MVELKKIFLRLPVGIEKISDVENFFITAQWGKDKYNYVASLPKGLKGEIKLKVHTGVQGPGDPEKVKSAVLEFLKNKKEVIKQKIINMALNRKEMEFIKVA